MADSYNSYPDTDETPSHTPQGEELKALAHAFGENVTFDENLLPVTERIPELISLARSLSSKALNGECDNNIMEVFDSFVKLARQLSTFDIQKDADKESLSKDLTLLNKYFEEYKKDPSKKCNKENLHDFALYSLSIVLDVIDQRIANQREYYRVMLVHNTFETPETIQKYLEYCFLLTDNFITFTYELVRNDNFLSIFYAHGLHTIRKPIRKIFRLTSPYEHQSIYSALSVSVRKLNLLTHDVSLKCAAYANKERKQTHSGLANLQPGGCANIHEIAKNLTHNSADSYVELIRIIGRLRNALNPEKVINSIEFENVISTVASQTLDSFRRLTNNIFMSDSYPFCRLMDETQHAFEAFAAAFSEAEPSPEIIADRQYAFYRAFIDYSDALINYFSLHIIENIDYLLYATQIEWVNNPGANKETLYTQALDPVSKIGKILSKFGFCEAPMFLAAFSEEGAFDCLTYVKEQFAQYMQTNLQETIQIRMHKPEAHAYASFISNAIHMQQATEQAVPWEELEAINSGISNLERNHYFTSMQLQEEANTLALKLETKKKQKPKTTKAKGRKKLSKAAKKRNKERLTSWQETLRTLKSCITKKQLEIFELEKAYKEQLQELETLLRQLESTHHEFSYYLANCFNDIADIFHAEQAVTAKSSNSLTDKINVILADLEDNSTTKAKYKNRHHLHFTPSHVQDCKKGALDVLQEICNTMITKRLLPDNLVPPLQSLIYSIGNDVNDVFLPYKIIEIRDIVIYRKPPFKIAVQSNVSLAQTREIMAMAAEDTSIPDDKKGSFVFRSIMAAARNSAQKNDTSISSRY